MIKKRFVEGLIRPIESRASLYEDLARVKTVTPRAVLYFLDPDCPGRKIWIVNALQYETSGRRMNLYMLVINTVLYSFMVKGVEVAVDRTFWQVNRARNADFVTRDGWRQVQRYQFHNFKLIQSATVVGRY